VPLQVQAHAPTCWRYFYYYYAHLLVLLLLLLRPPAGATSYMRLSDLKSFFSGPAFLPWFRMGNIRVGPFHCNGSPHAAICSSKSSHASGGSACENLAERVTSVVPLPSHKPGVACRWHCCRQRERINLPASKESACVRLTFVSC
jgi:hypothetical protein